MPSGTGCQLVAKLAVANPSIASTIDAAPYRCLPRITATISIDPVEAGCCRPAPACLQCRVGRSSREREVRDAGGRRDRLDGVVCLDPFEAAPQPPPAAEHDRSLERVDVVDEARRDEVARSSRATADPHVLPACCLL